MSTDKQLVYIDGAFSTGTGTTYSDVIDHFDNDFAIDKFEFLGKVTTAVTSGGAATVQWVLETSANEDMTSATTLWDSGAVAKATLVKGYTIKQVHDDDWTFKRYSRLKQVVATAALTAGGGFVGHTTGLSKNVT